MEAYEYEWQKEVDRYHALGYIKAVEEWHQDGCRKPLSYYLDAWQNRQMEKYGTAHEV